MTLVATRTPRTLMVMTRSMSSRVASSNGFGIAVPALFTSTSSRSKVVTVFSTAFLTASASAASAWIAIAFPPPRLNFFDKGRRSVRAFGVSDGDAGAFPGQPLGHRGPDAASTAGHERDFACQWSFTCGA